MSNNVRVFEGRDAVVRHLRAVVPLVPIFTGKAMEPRDWDGLADLANAVPSILRLLEEDA